MFNFLKRLFRFKKKIKPALSTDEQRQLLVAQSNFFYNEATKAYQAAIAAVDEGDEKALEIAKKQFFIAERRHKMTSFEIAKFVTKHLS